MKAREQLNSSQRLVPCETWWQLPVRRPGSHPWITVGHLLPSPCSLDLRVRPGRRGSVQSVETRSCWKKKVVSLRGGNCHNTTTTTSSHHRPEEEVGYLVWLGLTAGSRDSNRNNSQVRKATKTVTQTQDERRGSFFFLLTWTASAWWTFSRCVFSSASAEVNAQQT